MKNDSTYFHRALAKYGVSNFDIQIIDKCEDERLLDGLEIYWISYYDSTNPDKGYNLTSGGSG
nr:MAG: GIY-YIG catalytic domain protein [Bacteriophage sp.]